MGTPKRVSQKKKVVKISHKKKKKTDHEVEKEVSRGFGERGHQRVLSLQEGGEKGGNRGRSETRKRRWWKNSMKKKHSRPENERFHQSEKNARRSKNTGEKSERGARGGPRPEWSRPCLGGEGKSTDGKQKGREGSTEKYRGRTFQNNRRGVALSAKFQRKSI